MKRLILSCLGREVISLKDARVIVVAVSSLAQILSVEFWSMLLRSVIIVQQSCGAKYFHQALKLLLFHPFAVVEVAWGLRFSCISVRSKDRSRSNWLRIRNSRWRSYALRNDERLSLGDHPCGKYSQMIKPIIESLHYELTMENTAVAVDVVAANVEASNVIHDCCSRIIGCRSLNTRRAACSEEAASGAGCCDSGNELGAWIERHLRAERTWEKKKPQLKFSHKKWQFVHLMMTTTLPLMPEMPGLTY